MSGLDNICVDIETLSTRPNAVIVSIGAVKFSLKNNDLETFSININPLSCTNYGMHINPLTVEWWKKQPKEAIHAWQHSKIELSDALDKFVEFTGYNDYVRWYCNGTNFDFPILESAFIVTNKKEPWKHWMLTDMRTAYYLGGLDPRKESRVGIYHDAVSDCLTQIKNYKKAIGIYK